MIYGEHLAQCLTYIDLSNGESLIGKWMVNAPSPLKETILGQAVKRIKKKTQTPILRQSKIYMQL